MFRISRARRSQCPNRTASVSTIRPRPIRRAMLARSIDKPPIAYGTGNLTADAEQRRRMPSIPVSGSPDLGRRLSGATARMKQSSDHASVCRRLSLRSRLRSAVSWRRWRSDKASHRTDRPTNGSTKRRTVPTGCSGPDCSPTACANRARDEMALEVESVVDGGAHVEITLGGAS